MAKKAKGNRVQVILECTEHKASGMPGTSRYVTTKNRKNTTEVLNLLTELNKEGQSILMVTHDMKATLRATRILYLEDGKIIGELTLPPYNPDEVKSREAQVNAWLSSMQW